MVLRKIKELIFILSGPSGKRAVFKMKTSEKFIVVPKKEKQLDG